MAVALGGAVVRTMAVPAAVEDSMAGKAEADSTLAAVDIRAAKVFGVHGQPHHDRWVAARMAGLAARLIVRTSIPGISAANQLARMLGGT